MNIFKAAREKVGLTQEQSAELLNLSTDSIRAYEKGKHIPSHKTIRLMCVIYDDIDLYHNYLSIKSNGYIPFLEDKNIANLVLEVLQQNKDQEDLEADFIEIAKDGVIDEHEKPYFEKIQQEARESLIMNFAILNYETS